VLQHAVLVALRAAQLVLCPACSTPECNLRGIRPQAELLGQALWVQLLNHHLRRHNADNMRSSLSSRGSM